MRILFDQNIPANLRPYLFPHQVETAARLGWEELKNGDLIHAAEAEGFLTGDQELTYQQNLSSRVIAIIELTKNNWPSVRPNIARIVEAVNAATAGTYQVVECNYVFTGRKRPRRQQS